MKLAGKTHSIKASDLEAIYRRATAKHKTAKYVIVFDSVGLTLEGEIHR